MNAHSGDARPACGRLLRPRSDAWQKAGAHLDGIGGVVAGWGFWVWAAYYGKWRSGQVTADTTSLSR